MVGPWAFLKSFVDRKKSKKSQVTWFVGLNWLWSRPLKAGADLDQKASAAIGFIA
jgi:hypothetical protein